MRNKLQEHLQINNVPQNDGEAYSQYRVQSALRLLLDALIGQIEDSSQATFSDSDTIDSDLRNQFTP